MKKILKIILAITIIYLALKGISDNETVAMNEAIEKHKATNGTEIWTEQSWRNRK